MDRRVVAGTAVGVVVAGAVLTSPRAALSGLATLGDDPLAFAVAVAALYLVRPALAWPTVLCSAAVGYGFGVAGLPLALVGVVVTALPPFLVTRWIIEGKGTVDPEGRFGFLLAPADRVRELGEGFFSATGDVRGVTVSKLLPIPADVATCAAAAAGVSLRGFVVGTLVGELPWTVAAVVVGASAGRIVTGGLGSVGPVLSVAAVVAALTLLAGPAYRALSNRRPVVG